MDQEPTLWVDQLVTASAEAALDKMVLTSISVADAAEQGLRVTLARSDRAFSDADKVWLLELVAARIQESLYAKRSFSAVTNGKAK